MDNKSKQLEKSVIEYYNYLKDKKQEYEKIKNLSIVVYGKNSENSVTLENIYIELLTIISKYEKNVLINL